MCWLIFGPVGAAHAEWKIRMLLQATISSKQRILRAGRFIRSSGAKRKLVGGNT
jgi:hypothetical protein